MNMHRIFFPFDVCILLWLTLFPYKRDLAARRFLSIRRLPFARIGFKYRLSSEASIIRNTSPLKKYLASPLLYTLLVSIRVSVLAVRS